MQVCENYFLTNSWQPFALVCGCWLTAVTIHIFKFGSEGHAQAKNECAPPRDKVHVPSSIGGDPQWGEVVIFVLFMFAHLCHHLLTLSHLSNSLHPSHDPLYHWHLILKADTLIDVLEMCSISLTGGHLLIIITTDSQGHVDRIFACMIQ